MLIMYFMKTNISKQLLFQHELNIKTIEIFDTNYLYKVFKNPQNGIKYPIFWLCHKLLLWFPLRFLAILLISIWLQLIILCHSALFALQIISLGLIPKVKLLGQRHAHFQSFFWSNFISCCLYIFSFLFSRWKRFFP